MKGVILLEKTVFVKTLKVTKIHGVKIIFLSGLSIILKFGTPISNVIVYILFK